MRFPKLLITAGLCSSLLISHAAEAGILDMFEPSNIASTIRKQIAKAKIGTSINLVDADVFDGINLALKYKIQSEPSYINGFYTRIDQYSLSASVNPWEIIDEMDMPIGFNIRSGTDIIFARQFTDQKKSLLALPYTLKNIPLTAKKAIENLEVGDFVGFKANLNLIFSAGTFSQHSHLGLSASDHVAISGEFLVHAFRMPDNKMRLKLIATRGKSGGVNVKAGYDFDLKILGIKLIDHAIERRIEKFINLTPLQLGISRGKTDLFMLDYIFNLNDPSAATAYDNIMSAKLKFKAIELANPIAAKSEMEKNLFRDIGEVEEIFNADRHLRTPERRIDRVFKGSNEMTHTNSNFKFGLNLLRFESGATASRSHLTSTKRDDSQERFIFETFSPFNRQNFLFGLYGGEETILTSLLFRASHDFKPEEFVVMSLARERKMKNFSEKDYSTVKRNVKALLPKEVFEQIDWKNWDFSNGNRVNAFFRNEVFFHTPALAEMRILPNVRHITQLFYDYVSKRPQPKVLPSNKNENLFAQTCQTWVDCYQYDINMVAIRLSQVFDNKLSVQERYNAFVSLKNINLFQERGAGFLLTLIPEDKLKDVIHFELILDAKGVEPIQFRYGNFQQEELYRTMLYIQSVINHRGFDLRLYTDENGNYAPISPN